MRRDVLLTIFAFGLYGASKLAFNLVAVHRLDPAVVGEINALLALHTVLLVFTVQPIASVVNRYVPEHLASDDQGRASWLLVSGLILTLAISSALAGVVFFGHLSSDGSRGLLRSDLLPASIPYLWAYALYFYFKMAYYGYRRIGSYCVAELAGSLVFLASLGIAALSRRPQAFVFPWLAQPMVFSGFAVWQFRREFIGLRGGSLSRAWRSAYLRYGIYWLTAAASGFGAYHLSILAATLLQPNAASVGYYAVSLSVLSPLSLLPTSISMVLFPRMTQNDAWGEAPKNATLIRESTAALALPLAITAVIFCGFAPEILALINIPVTVECMLIFQLLTLGVSVSLLSTPAGSFLSATAYAGTASAIGVSTLALGLILWAALIPMLGVVGTAVGYAIMMVARGIANMVISDRHGTWWTWSPRRSIPLVGIVLLSTAPAHSHWPVGGRVTLIGALLAVMSLLMLPELSRLRMVMLATLARER